MLRLPAISKFLSDTINESLQKPLQPSGLFPSAIFFLLNLFIYPVLLEHRINFALRFRDLTVAWQIALFSVGTVILSYVLLSINRGILQIFTGEWWADSSLAKLLIILKVKRYKNWFEGKRIEPNGESFLWKNLKYVAQKLNNRTGSLPLVEAFIKYDKQLSDSDDEPEYERLENWQMSLKLPKKEVFLYPTALGDVISATTGIIWDRYKIDTNALWPYMEIVLSLSDTDEKLLTRIQNHKTTMDFLLNLSLILIVFSVENIVLRSLFPDIVAVVIFTIIPLACAYMLYRAAVEKAIDWSQLIYLTFELKREALQIALKLNSFKSHAHERESWDALSEWLMWGSVGDDRPPKQPEWRKDKFFKGGIAPPKNAVILNQSNNISIGLATVQEENERTISTSSSTYELQKGSIDYLITVNHKRDSHFGNSASFLIDDPRIPFIDSSQITHDSWKKIVGGATNIKVAVQTAHGRNSLLFHIGQLPDKDSFTIHYNLPIIVGRVKIESANGLKIEKVDQTEDQNEDKPSIKYVITIKNEGGDEEQGSLCIRDSQVKVSSKEQPTCTYSREGLPPRPIRKSTVEGNYFKWNLPPITPEHELTLTVKFLL